jgi:hypothetical protein
MKLQFQFCKTIPVMYGNKERTLVVVDRKTTVLEEDLG